MILSPTFMQKLRLFLFAVLLSLLASPPASAQSDDPSEVFLKAYMTSQQGEKLERENQFKAALTKYRFAGGLLEELKKRNANWQPAIVEYRSRKVSEAILRVQNRIGTQQDLAAASGNPAADAGDADVQVSPRNAAAAPANDAAIQNATQALREKVEQLEAELKKSRDQFAVAQKDRDSLAGKLNDTNSKLQQAETELAKSRGAEKQVRDQLATAQSSLKKIESSGAADAKAQEALRGEIAQLKKALEAAESGRSAAERERNIATAQLEDANKQVASVTAEKDAVARDRDSLLEQLKAAPDAEGRMKVLIAENSDLKQKLANAEKTVRELGEDKPRKEQEIAEAKRQLEQLRQQLVSSQKQKEDYEITIADLRSQLDDVGTELDKAKLVGANQEESQRLAQENEMLRNIVIRERQQEARREQAKKLMMAEFDKLKVKSQTLTQQVELLAQPVTKLSPEELALLRQPVVSISDTNPTTLTASFTAPKEDGQVSVTMTNPDAKGKPQEPDTAPGPAVQTEFKPSVPDDLVATARQAKESFDRGKFRQAEQQYQAILTKAPNNLYALSNLGVVLFRTGKLKAAEQTLKKAIAVSPDDEFSHTTLGIVYYRQGKFDDALQELTKALAINPKSATAHNYLGITASQKGWQEAAEKELLEAIAVNPDYADAHFNLAVVYATANPPSKELAKRHYGKATQLGAEPDPALEKMLN